MAISRQEVLEEIHRFVTAHGKSPGEREFAAATRIKESAWKGKLWARWTDAVREAGFEPNTLTQRIPEEGILRQFADFIVSLGHFPIRDEINIQAWNTPGFPTWQTIKKRLGGMPGTAKALLEFSQQSGDMELADLCEARLAREVVKSKVNGSPQVKKSPPVGFVYLKYSPSLRLYKIGKANDSNRRGAGISLLLPEDLIPKHEIRTDYPFILEKYWHNRFRTKKRQGEWFELTRSDIESFKKRREFMFCEYFP